MSSYLIGIYQDNEKELNEERKPLLSSIDSEKWLILSDIKFSFREADHWVVDLCGMNVKNNNFLYPLYALGTYPMVGCILTGLWVHRLVGQGGPVRIDETSIERETRAQWVYGMDGPFAVAAVMNAVRLLMIAVNKRVNRAATTDVLTIGLVLDLSYILGNIVFLDAMQRKDALLVRVAVVANASFGIGLVLLFLFGIAWAAEHGHLAPDKILDWIIRALVVAFFLAAASHYTELWHVYEDIVDDDENDMVAEKKNGGYDTHNKDKDGSEVRPHCFDDIWHIIVVCAAALVVWTLILLAVFWQGPHAVWAAVA
mmetsp:Transcript_1466/g.1943  ORF Transcript_1466/g.1943 Transcript_1466/m.1943 type:complete len:313 (-) Transcript_1466:1266-2204(-)|eukprot:CAMPEP_0197287938 /NCGR_PEP_ID=MMETSP0890-20130614/4790_1 /TAXON_ID=44058 ORGANISM="Aureoumbra lagunensis, Strain CCMP1510" /NCGR_SAMPLE_ID=MMETSP0890 /ASSEMBLY_ACC=CAM_ASM_000533 /LENGTH=312 /DNA_ID=CAMNT_0042758201 /DNA_START=152 /DNA_END=1090 /DNA_ORIENTATION=-